MDRVDRLIREYRRTHKVSQSTTSTIPSSDKTISPSDRVDRLLEAHKRGVFGFMRTPKFNENVTGLPKAKATEALIASREPAGEVLKKELAYRPQNAREWIFKPPTIALKAIQIPFQKAESAIANPLMELQKASAPNLGGRMATAFKEGLTSQRIGELGDIPRRAGFPEPLAKFTGFGSAMGTAFPIAAKSITFATRTGKTLLGFKSATPLQKLMGNIRRVRWSEIALGKFKSAVYVDKITRVLSKAERELIPFIREGQRRINPETGKLIKAGASGHIPQKLNRPDLIKLIKNPKVRAKLSQFVEKEKFNKVGLNTIDAYLDKAHQDIVSGMGSNVGYWENYVTHIWRIPKNKIHEVGKFFATRNPTLNKRFIGTFNEGINKFNLRPKTLDIAEILKIYDDLRYTTLANRKLVSTLIRNRLVRTKGVKGTENWKSIDHPAFQRWKVSTRNLPSGQVTIEPTRGGAQVKGKIPQFTKAPAVVNPEVYDQVKSLLDKPFEAGWINKLESVNAISKKLNLAISLFHHIALGETSVATVGLTKTLGLMAKSLYQFLRGSKPDIFRRIPQTQDAIAHTVSFSVPTDAVVGKFYGMLQTAEANAPRFTKGIVRGATKLSRSWDRALWTYFHNNLKLYAYEHLTGRALKSRRYAKIDPNKIKTEIGQFVNDTFGGQAWEALGKSKKWLQSMHWALLSPDWTYSTLRQALSPTGAGAIFRETAGLRKDLGRKFWLNAGLYFWGGMNALNYTLSKKYTGKGRFMWENPPDKKTQLFIGYKTDDRGVRREEYMRWGKQFRELPEFFMNPIKKFGGKLSPVVRESLAQFTKHYVGGFPTKFANKSFVSGLPSRVAEIGHMALRSEEHTSELQSH